MIDTEYVKYPPTSTDDIKDEKLAAYLKNIRTFIDEIKDRKISEFEDPSKNLVTMKIIN